MKQNRNWVLTLVLLLTATFAFAQQPADTAKNVAAHKTTWFERNSKFLNELNKKVASMLPKKYNNGPGGAENTQPYSGSPQAQPLGTKFPKLDTVKKKIFTPHYELHFI